MGALGEGGEAGGDDKEKQGGGSSGGVCIAHTLYEGTYTWNWTTTLNARGTCNNARFTHTSYCFPVLDSSCESSWFIALHSDDLNGSPLGHAVVTPSQHHSRDFNGQSHCTWKYQQLRTIREEHHLNPTDNRIISTPPASPHLVTTHPSPHVLTVACHRIFSLTSTSISTSSFASASWLPAFPPLP